MTPLPRGVLISLGEFLLSPIETFSRLSVRKAKLILNIKHGRNRRCPHLHLSPCSQGLHKKMLPFAPMDFHHFARRLRRQQSSRHTTEIPSALVAIRGPSQSKTERRFSRGGLGQLCRLSGTGRGREERSEHCTECDSGENGCRRAISSRGQT